MADQSLNEEGDFFVRSVRSLTGMPAVSVNTGKKLGRVMYACADKALTGLTGIWVSGRLGKASFYPAGSVSLLGDRAVMVKGDKSKKPEGEKIALRRAISLSGEMTGAVTNAYADEESLRIVRLEVSNGIFDDIARGRRLVRLYRVNEETGDTVILEEREGV